MRFRDTLGRGFALSVGIAYGAGMMYLLDPQLGRRRRALIRDQMLRARNELRQRVEKQIRNVINNMYGSVAEGRARAREGQIPDAMLEERVRAQIGHVVSHPASLEVRCRNGHVTLRGPVLAGERHNIERRLSKTRGVHNWTLDLREVADSSVPGLQGEALSQRKQQIG